MTKHNDIVKRVNLMTEDMERLIARLLMRTDGNDEITTFETWRALDNVVAALYALCNLAVGYTGTDGDRIIYGEIDTASRTEIAELLDKISRAWAKSEAPDGGTSSMSFESKRFDQVTKRLIENRKDALDALAKQDAERQDQDSG